MRLDQWLIDQRKSLTRTKAQQIIKDGHVLVNGERILKPSFQIADQEVVVDEVKVYVSRSAYKLKNFLPSLPFRVNDLNALDIGSSTGGFTQVLLEEGAAHVMAVDVGKGQLHESLLGDRRVTSLENTDIRQYNPGAVYELITSDVSFISLLHILEQVDLLASRWIILLFKPQFEVGRNVKRDKNGVVQDNKAIENAKQRFEEACRALEWELILTEPSSLKGKEGNIEYCYCFKKD
ncbi:MAG: TlyA family RNA methyltransferase [Epsilonproteobacteria bacterium]|nr:MAG: TlyA family RNA methyltransferase [Campylobacterota bacterium]